MAEALIIIVLGLIALGAVAFPVLAGLERYPDDDALDADLRRYREALRHDTVCGWCRAANPEDARYCGECGRPLD